MIPGLVYILCAATSLGSAVLLLRAGFRNNAGLLLLSSLCFFAMATNNVLLYVNFELLPEVNLLLAARLATVLAILLLNIGLIRHAT